MGPRLRRFRRQGGPDQIGDVRGGTRVRPSRTDPKPHHRRNQQSSDRVFRIRVNPCAGAPTRPKRREMVDKDNSGAVFGHLNREISRKIPQQMPRGRYHLTQRFRVCSPGGIEFSANVPIATGVACDRNPIHTQIFRGQMSLNIKGVDVLPEHLEKSIALRGIITSLG
jgi:hypothetical protein